MTATAITRTAAAWNRETERAFFSRLTNMIGAIKASTDPKATYQAAAKRLDRLYANIAIPPRIFAQADNRLLLALMRAENR